MAIHPTNRSAKCLIRGTPRPIRNCSWCLSTQLNSSPVVVHWETLVGSLTLGEHTYLTASKCASTQARLRTTHSGNQERAKSLQGWLTSMAISRIQEIGCCCLKIRLRSSDATRNSIRQYICYLRLCSRSHSSSSAVCVIHSDSRPILCIVALDHRSIRQIRLPLNYCSQQLIVSSASVLVPQSSIPRSTLSPGAALIHNRPRMSDCLESDSGDVE